MSDPQPISLRETRDLGGVISAAFGLLWQDGRQVAGALLRVCAPALVSLLVIAAIFGFSAWTFETTESGAVAVLLGAALFALGVSAWVLSVQVIGAVTSYAVLYRERGAGAFDAADVRRKSRSVFWRFAGVNALMVFAYFALNLLAFIPCLGALAALAGGAYLYTTFSLAYPVIADEGAGVVEAMKRCRRLVEDRWWMTFGVVVLAYLLYYLLFVGSGIPLSVLAFSFLFHGAESFSWVQGSLLSAAGVLWLGAAFFFQIIPHTAVVVQYFNLLERAEHAALASRVERVGEDDDREPGNTGKRAAPSGPPHGDAAEAGSAPARGSEGEDGARWRPEGLRDA
jgi:hypothetical protein